jgi:hypothetical protein
VTVSLLPHVGVRLSMDREIQKFLWRKGKSNQKRTHLINWVVVHALKVYVGLRVKDPTFLDIALGVKFL